MDQMMMSHDAYMRMLMQKSMANQGFFRSPYCREAYLENFNEFEQGMMTSPVIQGIATGGLIVTGAVFIETTSVAALDYLPNAAMKAHIALSNSARLQRVVGAAQGAMEGYFGMGDFNPAVYGSPLYILWKDGGNLIYNIYDNIEESPSSDTIPRR